ncbi:MbeD/MobD family mobilization/exclusion protein [Desulfobacula sp.]|uniref:MbeD/MobD family mobilization/exclusion protein n=1 Tax=Desulfobacula sp. TaxID=2593537 RepID=UPI002631A01F|nr:MbeD/MobD family mobilization/exclusion protein [Desulfobacula sp.]
MTSDVISTDKIEKIKSQFEQLAVKSDINREMFNSVLYAFCCENNQDAGGDKHLVRTELKRFQLVLEDIISRAEDQGAAERKLISTQDIGAFWTCFKEISKILLRNINPVRESRKQIRRQARLKGHLFSLPLQKVLTIESVTQKFKAEIEALNITITEMTDMAKAAESKNKKDLNDLKAKQKAQIDSLNATVKELSDSAKTVEDQHKTIVTDLEARYQKEAAEALETLTREYTEKQTAWETAEKELKQTISDITEKQTTLLNEKDGLTKEISRIQQDLEAQHQIQQDLETKHQQEIESQVEKSVLAEQEKATARESEHQDEIKKIQADYEEKIKALEKKTVKAKPKKKKAPAKTQKKTKAKSKTSA